MTMVTFEPFADLIEPIEFGFDMPAITRIDSAPDGASIPSFGDDLWSLDALVKKATAPPARVDFKKCPPALRPAVKRLMFVAINCPAQNNVGHLAKHYEYQAASTIANHFQCAVLPFMRLLTEYGIECLSDVQDEHYGAYQHQLAKKGVSLDYARGNRSYLTRLSQQGAYLPAEDRLPLPPWARDVEIRKVRKALRTIRRNTTPPIDHATLQMLLVWSLRFVEEFSSDILRAVEVTATMRAKARTKSLPGDGARAREGLETLRRAGRPLPGVVWKGKAVPATTFLALKFDTARPVLISRPEIQSVVRHADCSRRASG